MTKGGFGFSKRWHNLVEYVQKANIDKIKERAGLKKESIYSTFTFNRFNTLFYLYIRKLTYPLFSTNILIYELKKQVYKYPWYRNKL